jgi:tRNA threonylcarbamoyladenosine modification (KEOPS) complex  Pcc1 subunit
MESIKSRNKTIHTYNEETAEEIFQAIIHEYKYQKYRANIVHLMPLQEHRLFLKLIAFLVG